MAQLKVGSDTVVRVKRILKKSKTNAGGVKNEDAAKVLTENEKNQRWSYGLGLET